MECSAHKDPSAPWPHPLTCMCYALDTLSHTHAPQIPPKVLLSFFILCSPPGMFSSLRASRWQTWEMFLSPFALLCLPHSLGSVQHSISHSPPPLRPTAPPIVLPTAVHPTSTAVGCCTDRKLHTLCSVSTSGLVTQAKGSQAGFYFICWVDLEPMPPAGPIVYTCKRPTAVQDPLICSFTD